MTDDQPTPDPLGSPPVPDDAARERAIAGAMAHFDELVVEGALTPAVEAPPADEVSQRRAQNRRPGSQSRWLVAAAVALVLGVGGAVAAQFVGGTDDQVTSEASGQAEGVPGDTTAGEPQAGADAGSSEAGAPASVSSADAARTTAAPATEAAPTADEGAPETLPQWLCGLTARLGVEVCGP